MTMERPTIAAPPVSVRVILGQHFTGGVQCIVIYTALLQLCHELLQTITQGSRPVHDKCRTLLGNMRGMMLV